jgi:hypothetical protein
MAIRKRNKLWQADVVTPTGQRVRRSFPTKSLASDFIKGHEVDRTPKSQQRPEPLQLLSVASPKTRHSAVIEESRPARSSVKSARKAQPASVLATSPQSASAGKRSSQVRASATTSASVTGSRTSGVRLVASAESPMSPAQTVQPESSPTSSSSASSPAPAQPSDSCFYLQETQASEQRQRTAYRRRRLAAIKSEHEPSGTAQSLFPSPEDSPNTSAQPSPSRSLVNPSSAPSAQQGSQPKTSSASASKTRRKQQV